MRFIEFKLKRKSSPQLKPKSTDQKQQLEVKVQGSRAVAHVQAKQSKIPTGFILEIKGLKANKLELEHQPNCEK